MWADLVAELEQIGECFLHAIDRHVDALDQMLFDAVGEGAATKARHAQGREVDAWPRGAPLDRHRNLTGIGIRALVKSACRLQADHAMRDGARDQRQTDRKSGVSGKSVSALVDPGGARL